MADLVQGISTPTTRGTDHTHIMAPDVADVSAGHSLTSSNHNRSSSFRRHTSHSFSSHHSSMHHPSVNGYSCHPSHHYTNRNSCAPSHTYHFSCRHHSCHSTDWSLSHSSNSTTQHKDLSPEKLSNAPDPQHPIYSIAPRLSPSRIPFQILHQILTVTLIIY